MLISTPVHTLTQVEAVSFFEAASRTTALQEVLLGYVERGTRKTILNPRDKRARVMSCAKVHVLITVAGPDRVS